MLTRCACTFRRTLSAPTNFQLRSRRLRIHVLEKRYRSTSLELHVDSPESTADPQPWERILNTPIDDWRAENVVPGDLQATVKAHQEANLVRRVNPQQNLIRKFKSGLRSGFIQSKASTAGKPYNAEGIRIGAIPPNHKDMMHGIHRPELDALNRWMGDHTCKSHRSDTLSQGKPLERPSPLIEELKKRESDTEKGWTEKPPNMESSCTPAAYKVANPLRLRNQWVRHSGQSGGDPQRPWVKFLDTDTGDAMQRQVKGKSCSHLMLTRDPG